MTLNEFLNLKPGKYELDYNNFKQLLKEGFDKCLLEIEENDDDVFVVQRVNDWAYIDASPYTIECIEENDNKVLFTIFDEE